MWCLELSIEDTDGYRIYCFPQYLYCQTQIQNSSRSWTDRRWLTCILIYAQGLSQANLVTRFWTRLWICGIYGIYSSSNYLNAHRPRVKKDSSAIRERVQNRDIPRFPGTFPDFIFTVSSTLFECVSNKWTKSTFTIIKPGHLISKWKHFYRFDTIEFLNICAIWSMRGFSHISMI